VWRRQLKGQPLALAAAVALTVAAIALAARYIPASTRLVLVVAALTPYLMLCAPLALVLFAVEHCWLGVAVAGALTVVTISVQGPLYIGGESIGAGLAVRVVSANLRYGRADADAVCRLARDHADILAVQELTPDKARLISDAGIENILPYRFLRAREGPAGVGIWSRYPLEPGKDYDEFWLGLITAKVRLPRVPSLATVVTTHMSAPWPEPIDGWQRDLSRLKMVLAEIAALAPGVVIVAGDFNATHDSLEFRRLVRDGYRDAAEQAGAGLIRTHPADLPLLPAIFTVDHILTRDCMATSVYPVKLPGSDHRALVAEVTIPLQSADRPFVAGDF
jgi:endonuclease/exonuclease/phosphatase (EEP) superfamily protein YafD